MSKTVRRKVESGIYHIVLRGANKQTIFYGDELSLRISIILKTKNIYDIIKCSREEINEVLYLLKQNTVGAKHKTNIQGYRVARVYNKKNKKIQSSPPPCVYGFTVGICGDKMIIWRR